MSCIEGEFANLGVQLEIVKPKKDWCDEIDEHSIVLGELGQAHVRPRILVSLSDDGLALVDSPDPGVACLHYIKKETDSPRGVGTVLFESAVRTMRRNGFTGLYAECRNAAVVRMTSRLFKDQKIVLLPNSPRTDKEEEYVYADAMNGSYGEGLSVAEAVTYLSCRAGDDGFNVGRRVDLFTPLVAGRHPSFAVDL